VSTCDNLDDLFARDDVDALVIATPASTHEDLVRVALHNGRHVLVEKPMALNVDGCNALYDLAESAGRVLMVGYTFLYNGGVRKMKECMRPDQVREVGAVDSRRRVVFNDLNDGERVRVFERGVSAGEAIVDSYGEFKLLVRDGDIVSPKIEPSEPLKNQCLDFVASIVTGRPQLAKGRFGLGVVRTLAAIEAPMRLRGAAVDV